MVPIPAALAEKERLKAEHARARRERYEQRTGRARHGESETPSRGKVRQIHYRDYRFIGWDGEAPKDTGYSLFGSSAGHEICRPNLTTEECFDLLLEAKRENPYQCFVGFGGRYAGAEIPRQSIPLTKLARLKTSGTLWWHGYKLTECEGKIYTVAKAGVTVKIFEVTGWFHSTYVDALRNYGIGSKAQLERLQSEKNKRSEFLWKDIEDIKTYMRLELALMPELMERIRSICLDAGFDPRGWYGPSALARQCFTRHKVFDAMAQCPDAVNDAACYAFAGGRFEFFRGGIIGYNCTADKNSAYMHAALDLPNLRNGQWRRGRDYEANRFAVYRLRYPCKTRLTDVSQPNPLFRRLANGNVCWPRRVEGWYWAPEAELVINDPAATFLESWVFDENNTSDRPFTFVQQMYHQRMGFQSMPKGNPSRQAEMAFKWALASIYGQLARAVGWNRKTKEPPRTHQIEWAGYITSKCRAEMHKVALACGDSLISIDTDSVTAMRPITVPEGTQLGEWKTERHDAGIFFQNGVYFTGDLKDGQDGQVVRVSPDMVWSKGKMRGMERKRGIGPVTPELLTEAINTGSAVKMNPKTRYVTTRMALNGQFDHHGEWRNHPGNVLRFGGGGKRYHNKGQCERRCKNGVHVMLPGMQVSGNIFDMESYPHRLPWKHGEKAIDSKLLADYCWIDTENIDSDDVWQVELVKAERETVKNKLQDTGMVSPLMSAHRQRLAERSGMRNNVPAMRGTVFHSRNVLGETSG